MRIGLVLPSTPGYSETFFTNKIKGLQRYHKVILFTQTKRPDFNLCPVHKRPKVVDSKFLQSLRMLLVLIALLPHAQGAITYYKFLKRANLSHTEIIKRIYLNSHILKNKVDWLHFGFATQALGSEMVAKAIGAKMAVSFRGFDINVYPKKHKNCYTNLWKHVDKVHSISEYLVSQAYNLGLNKTTSVSIITPAINFDTIINSNHRVSDNSEDLTICTVARLNWIKDLTTALKTIKILKRDFPNITYNLIGDGKVKEKERYLFLTHQLDLNENVSFYNQLEHEETLQIMSQCDVYLQTSLNEGFCNALLEAQSLGKLCVATKVGGIPESVIDGETGWLVEAQNPLDIAKKILEVHNLTIDKKKEVTLNAKNRVKTKFNLKDQSTAFEDFYRD